MKIKKYFCLIFFIISTKSFCEEEPLTVLQRADEYFFKIIWTDSKNIFQEHLPEPFKLQNAGINDAFAYADINLPEAIYPFVDGLGVLDYSRQDSSLIIFFNNMAAKIKNKKIEERFCVKEKIFLPYLINYRLKMLRPIQNIFFSRPEYTSEKKASAIFKCFQKNTYYFIEITAVYSENKWLIESADFIGDDL